MYDLNKVIKEWHSKMKDDLESKVFSPKEQLLLFFDTETTGLPKNFNLNFYEKSTNWPHLVQLSWIMTDSRGRALSTNDFIIKPDGFVIPGRSTEIHGISHDYAMKHGCSLEMVLTKFMNDVELVDSVIAHNIDFDLNVVCSELYRMKKRKLYKELWGKDSHCTMVESTEFCELEGRGDMYGYKYPKLQELHEKLFGKKFGNAHNALADVKATVKCFFELKKRKII